jgi:hypothetical protein
VAIIIATHDKMVNEFVIPSYFLMDAVLGEVALLTARKG